MEMSDEYVLPLDHGAVAGRRRGFVMASVLQVVVAVGVPTAVGVAAGSFAIALPIYAVLGLVLLAVMWKDPERWRNLRAVSAHPPVFGPGGLRLRAVSTSGYDLRVPWSQVSRIVAKARGRRWNLLVHIENADGLADGDPGKLAALRKMQGPPGAPVIYPVGYVAADLNEMDEVVRRFSGERLSVERPE